MDMLERQQRHAQRLEELGLRRGLGGARNRLGGGDGGQWFDPLAPDEGLQALMPELTAGQGPDGKPMTPAHQRAAMRARARKYRLGQRPADMPQFIPQERIEAAQKRKEDRDKWQRDIAREDELRRQDRKQKLADEELERE
jgi:hypothetical protein